MKRKTKKANTKSKIDKIRIVCYPKYPKYFKYSIWFCWLWLVYPIVGTILELSFFYSNDQYAVRGIELHISIIFQFVIGLSMFIFSFFIVRQYKEAKNLVKFYEPFIKDNITFKEKLTLFEFIHSILIRRNTRISDDEELTITGAFQYALMVIEAFSIIAIIVTFALNIISLANNGLETFYPNIPIGFISYIYHLLFNMLMMGTILSFIYVVFDLFPLMRKVSKELDFEKIKPIPTRTDPSGGFKKIGIYLFRLSSTFLSSLILYFIISTIFQIFDKKYTIVNVLLDGSREISNSQSYNVSLYFIIIVPIIFFIIIFIVPQLPIHKKLKKYKCKNLELILEERKKIISKLFSNKNTYVEKTELKTELEFSNLMLSEIENISTWPLNYKIIISLLIANLLPLIIWIIQIIIEYYVGI